MTNWMTRWGKRDEGGSRSGGMSGTPDVPNGRVPEVTAKGEGSTPSTVPTPEPQTATAALILSVPHPARRCSLCGEVNFGNHTCAVPLCAQIADALGGIPVGSLKKSGVTVNTLVRAKSGEGIRLETLEKIARYLGWTITITDKEGNPIVRAS